MKLTMPWKASDDTPVNGVTAKLDEIRESLSEQAETLANVAANYSADAGKKASEVADEASTQVLRVAKETGDNASVVARDWMGSLSGVIESVLATLAALFGSIAASGRRTAADLGQDAQAAASELRKVRITTEPKKTGPDFMPGIALLGGFGAGVALMYFFDPEQGNRRRALLRDQAVKWTRVTRETASGKAKDLRNRAMGAAHETRKAVEGIQSEQAADAETQSWQPVGVGPASGIGSTDPSATDTWGEQPQPSNGSRVGIG
jgi:hypothetical protein